MQANAPHVLSGEISVDRRSPEKRLPWKAAAVLGGTALVPALI